MKRSKRTCLAALLALAAAATAAEQAAELSAAGLMQGMNARLRAEPVREFRFVERRHFPFRIGAVELEGRLRLWLGEGLSIEYPDKRTAVLVDGAGVLMRRWDRDGELEKEEAVAGDRLATVGLLRALFEFDFPRLAEDFNFELAEDSAAGDWTLTLRPEDPDASEFEKVVLDGGDSDLVEIEIDFGGRRRIEITPREQTIRESFSEPELERYFRAAAQ